MLARDDLLATVASLYYMLSLSQSEIARRMDMSTSKVSRLLKEARERGIVDIRIRMPIPRDVVLEQKLVEHFSLKDAYVLQTSGNAAGEMRLEAIGQLAANYIQRMLETLSPGASVGVAWGTGVHRAVSALPDHAGENIDAVQLIGGVGALAIDSPDLARIVAWKLGGNHYDLHAPVLVEHPQARDVLMAEPAVQTALRRAQSVNLAITGIGTMIDEASSFRRAGLLSSTDLAHLREQGVVGETCGRFFDLNGRYDDYAINRRTIGVELKHLQRIPVVLAVAFGLPKVKSIYGALQGNYLNVLVTDDTTARAILQLVEHETADGRRAGATSQASE